MSTATKTPPIKTPISVFYSEAEQVQKSRTQMDERPLRICVVFDEATNARSADFVIAHVTSDYICDQQSFCFDELDTPESGVAAARKAADADILVLAARGDQMLPLHVRI